MVEQIGAAVGGQLFSSFFNQKAAEKQQDYNLELMAIQNSYNKAAVDRQIQGQKELFEATGYGARVDQLKRAGLNPALIYGMGGSGGGITGSVSAPSVSPGSAPNMIQAQGQANGMALQLAKLQSEIEVNKSIAEANRAKAGLESIQTGTESFKQIGMDLDNKIKEISLNVDKRTVEDRVTAIKAASDKASYDAQASIGEMKSKLSKGTIDLNTVEESIKLVNLSIAHAFADIAMLKSNIKLNDENRKRIANEIEQAWIKSENDSVKTSAEVRKIMREVFNMDQSESDKVINEMVKKLIPNINLGTGQTIITHQN